MSCLLSKFVISFHCTRNALDQKTNKQTNKQTKICTNETNTPKKHQIAPHSRLVTGYFFVCLFVSICFLPLCFFSLFIYLFFFFLIYFFFVCFCPYRCLDEAREKRNTLVLFQGVFQLLSFSLQHAGPETETMKY